jgi:hypothetical protein
MKEGLVSSVPEDSGAIQTALRRGPAAGGNQILRKGRGLGE